MNNPFCYNIKCYYNTKGADGTLGILKIPIVTTVRPVRELEDCYPIDSRLSTVEIKTIFRTKFIVRNSVKYFCDECMEAIENNGFIK